MIIEKQSYNFFTVDVEDWFNATNLHIPISEWDHCELRVTESLELILPLLKKFNIRATFFVLAYLANRNPDIVRRIIEDGHEIASHGYYHQKITTLTKNQFRQDIEMSLESLTNISSQSIIGYRAPSFTITNETLWALEILKEYGFKYDSSFYPVKFHPDYGVSNIDSNPFIHKNGLLEFPLSSIKILNNYIPFSGGAYFRFYPYSFTKLLITKFIEQNHPYCFYFHPWELDENQPIANTTLFNKIRHYYNIRRNYGKLESLFSDFHFTNLGSYWEKYYGVQS